MFSLETARKTVPSFYHFSLAPCKRLSRADAKTENKEQISCLVCQHNYVEYFKAYLKKTSKHGTLLRFNSGCKCSECVIAANRANKIRSALSFVKKRFPEIDVNQVKTWLHSNISSSTKYIDVFIYDLEKFKLLLASKFA